jgi:hypothetical protein
MIIAATRASGIVAKNSVAKNSLFRAAEKHLVMPAKLDELWLQNLLEIGVSNCPSGTGLRSVLSVQNPEMVPLASRMTGRDESLFRRG